MGSRRLLSALPAAVIGYCYVGYPVLIEFAASRRKVTKSGAFVANLRENLPSVTIVVAAYNEEVVIQAKIDDLRAQDYPADLVRILVVADGSSDKTVQLARAKGVDVLWEAQRRGKSQAVNRGVAASDTELVVLTDANCRLAPNALRALVAPFTDRRVAVVSGAKTVVGPSSAAQGEGLYWKLEARLKKAESQFGATPGAVGELCALRRPTVRAIPPDVINDDYHLSCDALIRGYRVVYAPEAITIEPMSATARDEFDRRTRVAAGTWQGTLAHLSLANPRRGAVAWVFVSHRLLRNVVVPPLLPVLLALSIGQRKDRLGQLLLGAQALVYAGAALATRSRSRVLAAPHAFVATNIATLRGAARYLRKTQPVAWERVARAQVFDPAARRPLAGRRDLAAHPEAITVGEGGS
jgi:cellulose synthase/poly-beta-1,6-N-acetylglucosamine synthase-like glycosyltransferase